MIEYFNQKSNSSSIICNAKKPNKKIIIKQPALFLCYILFPLSSVASFCFDFTLWRNWIDLAWFLMGLYSLILLSKNSVYILQYKFLLSIVVLLVMSIWMAIGVLSERTPLIVAAMEIKPIFYFLVSLLIFRAYGAPAPETFCRMGVGLSVLLIVEFFVRSVISDEILRPIGSGEVNYDAALLSLSLIFALSRKDLSKRYVPFIFLGLLATFSRTGLLLACIILFCSDTLTLRLRVLMISAAISAGIWSFLMRDLEINLEDMDRYWMWITAFNYLYSNLAATALMAAPGSMLDVDTPTKLFDLWNFQKDVNQIEGIYPFHFHSAWLRLMLTWGWLPAILIFFVIVRVFLCRVRMPVQSRIFIIACLVLGLTMGLTHLGNVCIPFLLAMYLIYSSKQKPNK